MPSVRPQPTVPARLTACIQSDTVCHVPDPANGVFADWLAKLRDIKAKARVLSRLESLTQGNLGDTKTVGDGVRELRVHVGPGYRVYFSQTGKIALLLLCGGDKSTQRKDVEKAKRLLREIRED